MIRRPPRSTLSSSSAASDVYKRQVVKKRIESVLIELEDIKLELIGSSSDFNNNPFESVSYTHLRAHETPEHLVCRLLLEKKKQKTMTYVK